MPATGSSYPKSEDKLVRELLAALEHRALPSAEWMAQWEKSDNASANWDAMSKACALLVGKIGERMAAISLIRGDLSQPNDFQANEFVADDGHSTLGLFGRMAQRLSARPELGVAIDRWCDQYWAQQLIISNNPEAPDRQTFVGAGQRWRGPKNQPWKPEYLWLRGLGWSAPAIRALKRPGLSSAGDQIMDQQDPVSWERILAVHGGELLRDLLADVGRVAKAYAGGSWPAVARLITEGTRATLHHVRFAGGGYADVQENAAGLAPTRLYAACAGAGRLPVQYPGIETPVQKSRVVGAALDLDARKVAAHDEYCTPKSASAQLPTAEILCYVKTSRAGVEITGGGGVTLPQPPTPVLPPIIGAGGGGGGGCCLAATAEPSSWIWALVLFAIVGGLAWLWDRFALRRHERRIEALLAHPAPLRVAILNPDFDDTSAEEIVALTARLDASRKKLEAAVGANSGTTENGRTTP